jgi:sulfate transport system substrate-binding protein
VLDSGGRCATDTFVQRGIGDVLLAWENEALLALKEFGPSKFEIVVPSESILAEPTVAVVDENVNRHGTRQVAEAYLNFLYSGHGQTIIAEQYYRPRLKSVAAKFSSQFPKVKLFTIDEVFGAGRRPRKSTLATAAFLIRFTEPVANFEADRPAIAGSASASNPWVRFSRKGRCCPDSGWPWAGQFSISV